MRGASVGGECCANQPTGTALSKQAVRSVQEGTGCASLLPRVAPPLGRRAAAPAWGDEGAGVERGEGRRKGDDEGTVTWVPFGWC